MPGGVENGQPVEINVRHACQLWQEWIDDAGEIGEPGMIEDDVQGGEEAAEITITNCYLLCQEDGCP